MDVVVLNLHYAVHYKLKQQRIQDDCACLLKYSKINKEYVPFLLMTAEFNDAVIMLDCYVDYSIKNTLGLTIKVS